MTSARPTIAELREVSQPPTVRGRKNAEHWSGEYLRHGSLHLTRLLVPTPLRPNGVTVLMMLSGWCIAGSLLIPGILGPLLALFFSQLQMYLDCVDGELARWRKQFSPAGVYLDRVAHYTTEGFIGLALGLRAGGFIGGDPVPADQVWMYAFLGAVLMAGIMLNKTVNDLVHVARAFNGMDRLPDTAAAKTVPSGTLVGTLRRAARFLPFHRIFHSVELSLVAVVVSLVGLFVGDVTAFRVAVWVLTPAIWVVVAGHLLAVLASPRLRPTTGPTAGATG